MCLLDRKYNLKNIEQCIRIFNEEGRFDGSFLDSSLISYIDLNPYHVTELEEMEESWRSKALNNIKVFKVFNQTTKKELKIKVQDDFTVHQFKRLILT